MHFSFSMCGLNIVYHLSMHHKLRRSCVYLSGALHLLIVDLVHCISLIFCLFVCFCFLAVNLLSCLNTITDDDKRINATYVISIARKLGCSVFLLWDDIVEVSLFF